MKLSNAQKAEITAELKPLLQPYFDHQGWPSVLTADTATDVLLGFLRESGVQL